ncbi:MULTISPECIES: uracil-DNA glycosylase family protein [unclassified Lentimicrobium]|uniref:uracil-DNA glycosylase family protein n=1 Tax=unclassified Lentimicrobium TaxID=2677434 RepID=UPI0015553E82|nr:MULTISPECIES: uracil-DNA glycosylase family protein [unclassified Lentimicrobium]NPD47307.1 uracil-DNA glycosylase family protein [Lentimicrobium sp. S6]NPD84696.1 uracil-DNA glycosylase family protein [Lentimicrobium sp. L6]
MEELKRKISECKVCKSNLPLGPRPIITAHPKSKVIIIGQAPGIAVHNTGIPWDDKSGKNLRNWLGIEDHIFYDEEKIALIPMGFCYPGRGKSGDIPPRKECAPLWHEDLLSHLTEVKLVILIGKYAQDYYLKGLAKRNLTETVMHFEEYLPKYFVLPHPSPRNNLWQAKNPWFAEEVLPALKTEISKSLKK